MSNNNQNDNNQNDNNQNNYFNPMPFDSKSFVNNKDFYTKSLLFDKKNNINNSYVSRHSYKIPNNDQNSFAKLLFPNTSVCRDTGYLCRVEENSSRNLNRVSFDNEKFKTPYLNLKKSVKDNMVEILETPADDILN